MRKFLLVVIFWWLFVSFVEAKEPKWVDETVDFSGWKRIVVIELVPPFTQPIEKVLDSEVQNSEVGASEAYDSKKKKNSDENFEFSIAKKEWEKQVPQKLKNVQVISLQEMLRFLAEKDSKTNWQELWANSDQSEFFKKASLYFVGYIDGILKAQITQMSEGEIYTPPSTRTETYNQGGIWRNGVYSPRMVTRTVTTPGYYSPSWQASASFSLRKFDGTVVWTYEKSSNKPKKSLFKSKKPRAFFEDFFARALGESPLFKGKKPKEE